jgi:DNA-binding IclR family transcriptional regulator
MMRTTDSDPAAPTREPYRVQSVDRAVALLRAIATTPHPQTAWELARACGINRSTAWRLLQTLERHGMVERDERTQRYGIGYTAQQLAAAAGYDALARRARPILQRLADDTGGSVMLAAARTFSLVYVDQVDPTGSRPAVILNIWGPSQRVSEERLPELGRIVLRAAHDVSLVLE